MKQLEFLPEIYWNFKYGEAHFHATMDEKNILCRVTKEALSDHFGAVSGKELDVFKARRNEIEQITSKFIINNRYEQDESILIYADEVYSGYYHEEEMTDEMGAGYIDRCFMHSCEDHEIEVLEGEWSLVTHWMPLPKPPKQKDNTEG